MRWATSATTEPSPPCRSPSSKQASNLPVFGIDKDRRAIREVEPATDDKPYTGGSGRFIGPHNARERIAVTDRQSSNAMQ